MLIRTVFLPFLLNIALLLISSTAFTSETELLNNLSGSTNTVSETSAPASEPPETLSTPHLTVQTFVQSMTQLKTDDTQEQRKRALSTLDLSGIHTLVRPERGIENARILFDLIKNHITLPLPPETANAKQWSLPLQNQLGTLQLEKQEDDRWLFSKTTIAALPEIALRLSENTALRATTDLPLYLQVRNQMPNTLKDYPVS